MRNKKLFRVALSVVVASLCASCEGSIGSPPIPSTCTQIGAQCQRPEGPLGVCQETACAPGAVPPCFACTSQH